ncbi:MAG: sigma 54-interacting transcriptional regulator, partial [Desulfopila sp.]
FERVGGTRTLKVDVRIVAATNASLEDAVSQGKFRADLYYRLNVVPIVLPPLRDRQDDIPLLFNHFLAKSNQRNAKDLKITSELLDFLLNYSWPGNVREMQNLVERMVILAENDRITLSDLPPNISRHESDTGADTGAPPAPPESVDREPAHPIGGRSLSEIEREEVKAALIRNGWVQVRAARELGLTQRQMGYRIKKYGLNRYDCFR